MVRIAGDSRADFVCSILGNIGVKVKEKELKKVMNYLTGAVRKEREIYNQELKKIPEDLCKLSHSLGKREAFLEIMGQMRDKNV
jgi:hypothetical protein